MTTRSRLILGVTGAAGALGAVGLGLAAALTVGTTAVNAAPGVIDRLTPPGIQMLQGHPQGGAYVGLGLVPLTDQFRQQHGTSATAGLGIARVADGSPAAQAGIAAGSVLLTIDGTNVTSLQQARTSLEGKAAGATVSLGVQTGNAAPRTVQVTLAERPAPPARGDHQKPDGSQRPGPAALGTVASVSASAITVTRPDNTTATYQVTPQTRIMVRGTENATIANVAQGNRVAVVSTDGSSAAAIMVIPDGLPFPGPRGERPEGMPRPDGSQRPDGPQRPGGPQGERPDGMQRPGPATMGTVASVSASAITVTKQDNTTATYQVNAQTRIVVPGTPNATIANVTQGSRVAVVSPDGSNAAVIMVIPANAPERPTPGQRPDGPQRPDGAPGMPGRGGGPGGI